MKFKNTGNLLSYIILPIIALTILAVSYLRLVDNYELETLDIRFHLRPKPVTTDKVVLIEMGDDTFKNLGQWPIPRNYHALLIKALSEAGARSIVFDIFFSESGEYDDDLESAIKDAKNVYLPFVLKINSRENAPFATANGYVAKNLERFSSSDKGEGHINIVPDIDGKFRRVPLLVNWKDKWYPYISLLAVCDYLNIPIKNANLIPGRYISLDNIKIPLDDSSNMIINFSGPWGEAYKHYSYYDIVQSYLAPIAGQKPILDLSIFKDKVCIVGLTATGTADLHPNPLEALYPAFGIHAEIFNSILSKHFIVRTSKEINLLILIFLAILIGLSTLKTKPIKGLIILAAVSALFIVISTLLFNMLGLWIDLFYPILVLALLYLLLTLYKYITEWKKRLVMENELNIASKIQESFLPKQLPRLEGLDMSVIMSTARQVGGDLYDFAQFSDSEIGVMIGDVSGKGVPASLFMAKVNSEFEFFANPGSKPQEVLSNLNSKLVKESGSNLFVTVFYMIFDMKNNMAEFSNGGHLPAIHLNQAGVTEFLDVSEGTPLGLIDSSYSGKNVSFKKQDIFVLYTDGITEAMNKKREFYTEERLCSVIKNNKKSDSKGLLDAIRKDVGSFEPKFRQHDDMTLIVIKIV
jgi:adenylate cyclase